jgi:hypothetical protein
MTDSGEVDRARKRRAIVFLSIVCGLPLVFVSFAFVKGHAGAGDGVALAVGLALVAGIIFFSGRSGARSASRARVAHPEALFIARAFDPKVLPRGVRVLLVDAEGLHLATLRSSSKLKWSVPWSSVSGAALGAVRMTRGTGPGVIVALRDGKVKAMLLPTASGFGNDLQACQDLVRTVNERVAHNGPAVAS